MFSWKLRKKTRVVWHVIDVLSHTLKLVPHANPSSTPVIAPLSPSSLCPSHSLQTCSFLSTHPHGSRWWPETPISLQSPNIITLLPVGGTLLLLSGLSFIGSMIGLAVATLLFLIFSPVLVPEAIGIGLSVTGVLTSWAFGMTALSSLSWLLNYLRQAADSLPKSLRVVTDKMGQKMKEMGHEMQKQAHDGGPIVRRFL